MSRRLKLAQRLLKNTGCIFIAIDQNELYYLKILCDMIFGEENFINDFMWLHGKGKKDRWSRTLQQHTLCYAKDRHFLQPFADFISTEWATSNADSDPRGNWFSGSISFTEKRSNPNHKNYYTIKSPSGIKWTRQWLVSEDEMNELLSQNKIFFGKAPEFNKVPRVKIFNQENTKIIPKNIIDCTESTRKAQTHLDNILGAKKIFDNPKPVDLISHLISITQNKNDALIMDFFAGSGTTLESVLELNNLDGGSRKCILIQKPEATYSKNGQTSNAYNNGFSTISEICKKRIESVLDFYNKNYGLNEKIENIKLLHE
jgi:adenine-specific DNA-methyltransferase